jgi:hypothetical protein
MTLSSIKKSLNEEAFYFIRKLLQFFPNSSLGNMNRLTQRMTIRM